MFELLRWCFWKKICSHFTKCRSTLALFKLYTSDKQNQKKKQASDISAGKGKKRRKKGRREGRKEGKKEGKKEGRKEVSCPMKLLEVELAQWFGSIGFSAMKTLVCAWHDKLQKHGLAASIGMEPFTFFFFLDEMELLERKKERKTKQNKTTTNKP